MRMLSSGDPPPVPLNKGEAIGCARWFVRPGNQRMRVLFVRPGTCPVPPLKKGG